MESGEPVAIDYNLRRTAMVSTEQGYDVLDSYVRNDKTQTTEQYNKNYVEGQLQSVAGVQCMDGSSCAVNLQTGAIQDGQGNELATAAISNYNQDGVWGYQIDANEYTAAKYLIVGDVYWSWSTWSHRAEWYLVYSQDIVIASNTVFVNEVAFNDMRSALQDMPAR